MFVEGAHSGCHWGTRWATHWYAVDLCVAADQLPDEGLARYEERLSIEAAREAENRAPVAVERVLSDRAGRVCTWGARFFLRQVCTCCCTPHTCGAATRHELLRTCEVKFKILP